MTLNPLAAVSAIGRGQTFESIKDRIVIDVENLQERLAWVQYLAGARVMINALGHEYESEMKLLVEHVDRVCGNDL